MNAKYLSSILFSYVTLEWGGILSNPVYFVVW